MTDVYRTQVFPLLTILWFVFCTIPAAGVSGSLYNEGNALYREGRYSQAAEQYEALIGAGLENGYLYYNLGNAYFKMGEIGRARLAYERALRLLPGDEDVLANLAYLASVKVDKDPSPDPNMLTRMLLTLYDAFHMNTLTILSSVLLFAAFGSATAWLFLPSRRVIWIALMVVGGLGLALMGPILAFKVHQQGAVEAVILSEEIEGRSGPGQDFLLVFTLHEGTKAAVERVETGWVLIRLSTGLGAWVPTSALEAI